MITSTRLASTALMLTLLAPAAGMAQVDFSRYVALGDSYTAAETNLGLIETAQQSSYPALLHRQSGASSSFNQPLFASPGLSLEVVEGVPTPVLQLTFDTAGLPCNPFVIAPPALPAGAEITMPPYDNLGVPGARMQDAINQTGGGYASLILAGGGSQLDQALAKDPTFVTVWLGINDIFRAVGSGLVFDGITLTTEASFAADLDTVIDALAATGADLAIANIPRASAVPFATTIPPVVAPDPATCGPVLVGGAPVPLLGPDGPLASGDLVLLTAASKLALGIGIPVALGGSGIPLADEDVLSVDEQQRIETRRMALNELLRAKAEQVGAAYVDLASFFDDVRTSGLVVGNIDYTSDFLLGGLFSYDAFHASAFAYAVIANEFIAAINARFGSSIPLVDLYPFVFGGASAGPVPGADVPFLSVTPQAARAMRAMFGVAQIDEIKRQAGLLLLEERRAQDPTAPREELHPWRELPRRGNPRGTTRPRGEQRAPAKIRRERSPL